MKKKYSVKQLSKLAGVSIRTLHLYDSKDLLKPEERTEAGYRLYGESELLRLQQILFYKELDFPLSEIKLILDDPDFNVMQSLASQRKKLAFKKSRLVTLLKTIDKTIDSLKNKTMLNAEELYQGLSPEKAAAYRKEAVNTYGIEVVEKAEDHLMNLDKDDIKLLLEEQKQLAIQLYEWKDEKPYSDKIQKLVNSHYINTRKLWGTHNAIDKQPEAYKGLGLLYLNDARFTLVNGVYSESFAQFLNKAMTYFAENNL